MGKHDKTIRARNAGGVLPVPPHVFLGASSSIQTKCGPEQLWVWLTHSEHQNMWIERLIDSESIDNKLLDVGSRFRARMDEAGIVEYEGEITTFQKNERLGVRLWERAAPRDAPRVVEFRLEPCSGGTRLHVMMGHEVRKKGVSYRFMKPVFKLLMAMLAKKTLRAIKRNAEASA